MKQKTCTKCTSSGPFGINSRNKDGLSTQCSACLRKSGIRRYHARLDHNRAVHNTREKARRAKFSVDQIQSVSRKNYARKITKLFGSPDGLDRLLKYQRGVCAICERLPIGLNHQNGLHVDHDHVTGMVRGLLCNRCNISIGGLGDNYDGILRALNYMRNPPWPMLERQREDHLP